MAFHDLRNSTRQPGFGRHCFRPRLHPLNLLLCCLVLGACSPTYVVRAAYEEAKILSRRRPIERVIADPATPEETRHKLSLVTQARDFAAAAVGLDAGESYTTFSYVDSDTLLLVVSGAEKDRFRAYTWWFPIVGRVPYKGFFRFGDAFREAERLEAAGYDSYVRPSGAFSTLGWFNDPLLNTLLRYDDVSLAGTVIHEILHNTIYVPSEVSFNESFANFVGERGAVAFFCERDGTASERCRTARASWQDHLTYGAFLTDLVQRLEALYGRDDIGRDAKLALREQVFADAMRRFTTDIEPRLLTGGFRGFTRRPVNNATLIGTRLYYDRLHLFEQLYRQMGEDYVGTVHAVIDAVRDADDPWLAVAALVERTAGRAVEPGDGAPAPR